MVKNVTKITHKLKKINWLSIEKNILEWEKMPYYNYEKVFWLKKFCFFIRKSIRNFFSFAFMFAKKYKTILFLRVLKFLLKYKNVFKLEVVQLFLFLFFELRKLHSEIWQKHKECKLYKNIQNIRYITEI